MRSPADVYLQILTDEFKVPKNITNTPHQQPN